jgi:hypothetical protein
MSDYQQRQETIVRAEQTALYCTFAFNELLAVLDDGGQATDRRARFVGLEVDEWGEFTGRAHVSIVNGPCRMIPLRQLAHVRQ